MNSKLLLFASLMLIAIMSISCYKQDDLNPMASLSPIVDAALPANGLVGQEINFIVKHAVFNGCGYYAKQETTQLGSTLMVTFYAQYSEGFCTMDIPIRNTNYKFIPEVSGTYTFKFNKGEGQYLVKTIQIN